MAEFKSYREASKTDWGSQNGAPIDRDQIRLGCLLRIADATEKVAANYDAIRRDRDLQRELRKGAERALATEKRRTAALRGHLRRAKRGAK